MKEKRYYKVNEAIWSITHKQICVVKEIDTEEKTMTVYFTDEDGGTHIETGLLWEFDKLSLKGEVRDGSIGFTKFRPTAKIPMKNHFEDAGYDVYLDFPQDATWTDKDGNKHDAWSNGVLSFPVMKNKPTLLPTGIGVRVSDDFYTDWANERGSTGLRGMSTLSGVVDAGYRGEVFIDIAPVYKNIIFVNNFTEIREDEENIYFPITKAVSQMIVRRNLHLQEYLVSLDDFVNDDTNRGDSRLGASGK